MRKGTKYAATAAAALLGLGAASTTASASIVKSTGGPGFTGLSASGSGHTFTATGSGGTVVVTCTSASFANISGVGDMNATFNPTYTGCTADVSGILCAARVSTPGTWTLTQGGTKTGGWTGSATLGSAAKVEVDDPGCGLGPTDCTINIGAQGGLTGSTVLASNNATSTAVKLQGIVTGISWSSATPNCGIGSGAANATYSINGTGGITINGIKLT
jgi:hypothetical protein